MQNTKSKILDAAEKLFAERSYEGVSVLEIAKIAGVSKSLIFHHFENKLKIFTSLVRDRFEKIEERLSSVFYDPKKQPSEKLFEFLDTYVELLRSNAALFKIALREAVNANKEISSLIIEHNAKIANNLCRLIEEGIRKKEFLSDVDPLYSAILIVLTLNSLSAASTITSAFSPSVDFDIAKVKIEVKKLLIRGVLEND